MFAVSLPTEANAKKKPSIIDMANAAYSMNPSSSTSRSRNNSTSSTNLDERLDAARAMLGISPCSVADGTVGSLILADRAGNFQKSSVSKPTNSRPRLPKQTSGDSSSEGSLPSRSSENLRVSSSIESSRRPRSNSAGLDALAFLASRETEAGNTALKSSSPATVAQSTMPFTGVSLVPNPAVTSSDDDEDSEIMPPHPPRTTVIRRRRSVSNPEGMGDKWGLTSTRTLPPSIVNSCDENSSTMRRLRLVLPTSILEEEMAEANAAVIAKEKSTAAASLLAASILRSDAATRLKQTSKLPLVVEEEDEETDTEEEILDHEELLRRARSRLLEDLSQSNLSGEKGVLTLPHSLRKYKEVYNKNGRIGIYTPAERAAIIARFQSKRTRRVWNKKIRYNCRKNLADRRLRVKGRFVKRSAEPPPAPPSSDASKPAAANPSADEGTQKAAENASVPSTIPEEAEIPSEDADMPDVSDPDAGFCPTENQPYRRMRRHTIT